MISFHTLGWKRADALSGTYMAESELLIGRGESIYARPIRRDDAEAIQTIYTNLSPGSKYMRFNTNLGSIAPAFLSRLSLQMAIKATEHGYGLLVYRRPTHLQSFELPIGMGCYIRSSDQVAELDLTVSDLWQGLGLGSRLLRRLLHQAKKEGYLCLEAYVNQHNRPMQAVINKAGHFYTAEAEGSMFKYQIMLR